MATPIETDAPTTPTEAAREAAPARALMLELSSAFKSILPASTTVERVNAFTSVVILFITAAPAPLTLTPTKPPEAAAEPATTRASMD